MKIAMIGQKGIPALFGGIERYTEELSVRLAERGHDVVAFSRSWYTPVAKQEHRGVTIVHTPTLHTKYLDAISHTLTSLLKASRMQFDVVHLHGVGPSLLAWLPKLIMPKTRLVVTFHCIDRKHAKWGFFARLMLRLGEWMACHFADETITVSKTLHQYCIEAYEKETTYIPSGAPEAVLGNARDLKIFGLEADQYVLYVGRLVAHKRIHDLIAAWKYLRVHEPGLVAGKKLAIVGGSAFTDSYLEELRTLATNADGSRDTSIVFTGYQSDASLAALYTHAIAVVNPSESEGLPIATIEAMSYAKPVIASDIAENMELAAEFGIPFPRRNVAALTEKLSMVLRDPAEAKRIGERARDFVRQEYHIDTMADRIERVYTRLLESAVVTAQSK